MGQISPDLMSLDSLDSNGLHGHQFNPEPLGCGGTEVLVMDIQLTYLQLQRDANIMLTCQHGPKSLRNVSNTVLKD